MDALVNTIRKVGSFLATCKVCSKILTGTGQTRLLPHFQHNKGRGGAGTAIQVTVQNLFTNISSKPWTEHVHKLSSAVPSPVWLEASNSSDYIRPKLTYKVYRDNWLLRLKWYIIICTRREDSRILLHVSRTSAEKSAINAFLGGLPQWWGGFSFFLGWRISNLSLEQGSVQTGIFHIHTAFSRASLKKSQVWHLVWHLWHFMEFNDH